MHKHWLIGLALLAFAGMADAQNPLQNLLVGVDNATVNLNETVNSLLRGNASATAVNLDTTVSTLLMDISVGTPLVGLADSGVALSSTLTNAALGVTSALDQLVMPLAEAGTPLTRPLIGVTDSLLGSGLGVPGDAVGVGQAPGPPLLGDDSLLGGLPLIGTLLGTGEAAPIVGGLIGGNNGLFAGTGSVPIFGGLFNAGMVAANGQGLSADELPFSAAQLDPGTRSALANGVRLQGL